MELKDLAALFLMAVAISAGVLTTCLSQRARDAPFFLLILASAITDRVAPLRAVSSFRSSIFWPSAFWSVRCSCRVRVTAAVSGRPVLAR